MIRIKYWKKTSVLINLELKRIRNSLFFNQSYREDPLFTTGTGKKHQLFHTTTVVCENIINPLKNVFFSLIKDL